MLDFIKSKKKSKFHARPKVRDKDEIALQYNKAAISVGHLALEIQEHRNRILECENTILEHLKGMGAARFEAQRLPKDEPTPAPTAEEGAE